MIHDDNEAVRRIDRQVNRIAPPGSHFVDELQLARARIHVKRADLREIPMHSIEITLSTIEREIRWIR